MNRGIPAPRDELPWFCQKQNRASKFLRSALQKTGLNFPLTIVATRGRGSCNPGFLVTVLTTWAKCSMYSRKKQIVSAERKPSSVWQRADPAPHPPYLQAPRRNCISSGHCDIWFVGHSDKAPMRRPGDSGRLAGRRQWLQPDHPGQITPFQRCPYTRGFGGSSIGPHLDSTSEPRSDIRAPNRCDTTAYCDIVTAKESAMLNWLVRMWHRIEGWMHPRQTVPNSYHPSNLHGRHR